MWVLALIPIALGVTVTTVNVGFLHTAQAQATHWDQARIVGCSIVFGDNEVNPRDSSCPSGVEPPDPQMIAQQRATAGAAVEAVERLLAPEDRAALALRLLGSLPGVVLAVLVAVMVTGGEYTWHTWGPLVGAVGNRTTTILGKAIGAITLSAAITALGVIASVIAYGIQLGGWAWPTFPIAQLVGSTFALGLGVAVGLSMSIVIRSAAGGLVAAGVVLLGFAFTVFAAQPREAPPGLADAVASPGASVPWPLAPFGALAQFLADPVAHPGAGDLTPPHPVVSAVGLEHLPNMPTVGVVNALVLVAWTVGLVAMGAAVFARQEIRS